MEIKIDTKKDSVDDIKEVIKFLQSFVNESSYSSDYGSSESEGMFSMFGDSEEETSSSSAMNIFDEEEVAEEPSESKDIFGNTIGGNDSDDEDVSIQPYS